MAQEDTKEQDMDKALKVIMKLGKAERAFLKDIPAASVLPPLDVHEWVRHGWVAHVGKWCVLTPLGGSVATTQKLTKEILTWFQILTQVPSRTVLSNLENAGVIENRDGFPIITSFGRIVQAEIQANDDYMRHNSWRLPQQSEDLPPTDGHSP